MVQMEFSISATLLVVRGLEMFINGHLYYRIQLQGCGRCQGRDDDDDDDVIV